MVLVKLVITIDMYVFEPRQTKGVKILPKCFGFVHSISILSYRRDISKKFKEMIQSCEVGKMLLNLYAPKIIDIA